MIDIYMSLAEKS